MAITAADNVSPREGEGLQASFMVTLTAQQGPSHFSSRVDHYVQQVHEESTQIQAEKEVVKFFTHGKSQKKKGVRASPTGCVGG